MTEAQAMADLIENWLGSQQIRRMLAFCASRDNCGRRVEIALKRYVGENTDACIKCRTASVFIGKIMDRFIDKYGNKEKIKSYLMDPMWRKGLSSVIEGVAEWGPRKPFTAYAPFLVVWNVTRQCNLRCKHCYALAGQRDKNELNDAEALSAVDKMAEAGVAYIALSGGEPLIRSNIWEITDRIRNHGMAFSIATNATLMTKENAEKLKEKNCLYVQISVDGASPETHDFFRGEGAFEKTMKGIKNAVSVGLHVGIACTITQHNYNEVSKIIDLAENIGAKTFMHYNFIPTGRGKDIVSLDLTPQQRENLLVMLVEESKKRKIQILSTACQFSRVCIERNAPNMSMTHFDNANIPKESPLAILADFVGGCGTGRLYCALDYDGSITPCVFIPIKLGNIRNDDLLDVWLNADAFRKIRDRVHFTGACGTCNYRNVCGGCRARAYGYFNDLQASDVGCILNKDEWIKIKAETR